MPTGQQSLAVLNSAYWIAGNWSKSCAGLQPGYSCRYMGRVLPAMENRGQTLSGCTSWDVDRWPWVLAHNLHSCLLCMACDAPAATTSL